MIKFLVQRVLALLATALLAVTFAFIALRAIPGDAVAAQLARSGAGTVQIAERRSALHLDQPLLVQYGAYLGGLLRGDLGSSLTSGRSVSEIIGEQFAATLELAVSAASVAIGTGLLLGMIVETHGNPLVRALASLLTNLALSVPVYFSGMLALLVFSVSLHLLPSSGGGDALHLILPAGVLGFNLSGSIARVTAASLREAWDADFARTGRAKGLSERQVLIRHVLRASLPPIFSVIALQIGFLLGGAAITEALFVRPGIGQILLTSLGEKDYPVVQGVVLIGALTYSAALTLGDVLSAAADPRMRSQS